MKDFDEKLNHLAQAQDTQGKLLHEVHKAIIGDPAMGQKGVVPTLEEHHNRIKGLEETNKMLKWTGRVLIAFGGFIGWPYLKAGLVKLIFLIR